MRRFLASVGLALIFGALAVTSASAAPIPGTPTGRDCLHPPMPQSPTNVLDPGPANPATGDPFADGATVSIYEVYGYAGLRPVQFDPGCSPVMLSWTPLAAATNQAAQNVTAITVRLWRTVTDGTLGGILDPVQATMARGFGWGILVPLLGFGLLFTAAWFVARATYAQLADTMRQTLVMLLVIGVGVAALFYPLVVGPAVDRAVNTAIATVNQAVTPAALAGRNGATQDPDAERQRSGPGGTREVEESTTMPVNPAEAVSALNAGDAIAINIHQSVLYPTWLAQTFGADNNQAAKLYGPELLKASALSREEQAQIDADPSKAGPIIEGKQNWYKDVARTIQENYPQAYEHVAGNDSLGQLTDGLLGLFATGCAVFFLLYGLWKVTFGLVITRIAIGTAPALAVVSQHPAGQPLFWSVLTFTWRALLTGLVAGTAAVLFLVAGIGQVLSAATTGVPLIVKALILLVMAAVMWKLMQVVSAKAGGAASRSAAKRRKRRKRNRYRSRRYRYGRGRSRGSNFHRRHKSKPDPKRRNIQIGPSGKGKGSTGPSSTGKGKGGKPSRPSAAAGAGRRGGAGAGAKPPSRTAAAARGARNGAAAGAAKSAVLGAFTGGTVTAGAVAAGAAKGAAAGAASAVGGKRAGKAVTKSTKAGGTRTRRPRSTASLNGHGSARPAADRSTPSANDIRRSYQTRKGSTGGGAVRTAGRVLRRRGRRSGRAA